MTEPRTKFECPQCQSNTLEFSSQSPGASCAGCGATFEDLDRYQVPATITEEIDQFIEDVRRAFSRK